MPDQSIDPSVMNKLCVICGKEFGPALADHCTDKSLVAIARTGWPRPRTHYYSLDGKELNESDLAALKQQETPRMAAWEQESRKPLPSVFYPGYAFSPAGSKNRTTALPNWISVTERIVNLVGFVGTMILARSIDHDFISKYLPQFYYPDIPVLTDTWVGTFRIVTYFMAPIVGFALGWVVKKILQISFAHTT